MILGYAGDFSVLPGQTIDFHFSADADGTRARIHFYRYGLQGGVGGWIHVGQSSVLTIDHFPRGSYGEGWGWPTYTWTVPANWHTGVYIAFPLPSRAIGARVDPETGRMEQVLFVVKSATPGLNARILYKVPFFTYGAYDGSWLQDPMTGASSLYQQNPVTLHRPGIGNDPWDTVYVDFEDSASFRQTFIHWDAKMIAWLETNQYSVDYCTDLDIHRDASLIHNYCLMLSVGHDEYWTEEMRASVESFISNGGNVAFFSGNSVWWRTVITESSGDMQIARIDNWPEDNLETRLTGVSWRHGSGRWSIGQREAIGYTVQHSDHWVFENTALVDGAVIGANERLVGYECDGSALIPAQPGQPRTPSFIDGTPFGFTILGFAKTPAWDTPDHENEPTMGIYTNIGIVFTAATTDWPRVLDAGNAEVVQITKNVLDHLASSPAKITGPITAGGCFESVATVGKDATFYVANAPAGATIQWSVAGGAIIGPDDEIKVVVKMPLNPDLVTIWVTVTEPGKTCPGFGTVSITPVTAEQYYWLQLICELLHLVIGSTTSKKAISGVQDKLPFAVDPLWDPLRGGFFLLSDSQLRQLKRHAMNLIRTIDRITQRRQKRGKRAAAGRAPQVGSR
jgi:hypothetical protein